MFFTLIWKNIYLTNFVIGSASGVQKITLVRGAQITEIAGSSDGFSIWFAGRWVFVEHKFTGTKVKWDRGTRISVMLDPKHTSEVIKQYHSRCIPKV